VQPRVLIFRRSERLNREEVKTSASFCGETVVQRRFHIQLWLNGDVDYLAVGYLPREEPASTTKAEGY
jgi:hypothetical protein